MHLAALPSVRDMCASACQAIATLTGRAIRVARRGRQARAGFSLVQKNAAWSIVWTRSASARKERVPSTGCASAYAARALVDLASTSVVAVRVGRPRAFRVNVNANLDTAPSAASVSSLRKYLTRLREKRSPLLCPRMTAFYQQEVLRLWVLSVAPVQSSWLCWLSSESASPASVSHFWWFRELLTKR